MTLENISQYGVFIHTTDGYIPMALLQNSNYPELRHFKTVPSTTEGLPVELVIHSDSFGGDAVTGQVRKLALAGGNEDISFSVTPTAEKNKYLLTPNTTLEEGQFLFLQIGWNECFAVFLGNAEKALVTFFSDTTMTPAYAAIQDLETVVGIFPNNEALKALLPKWEEIAKAEKETTDFKYVAEAWKKYQEAEKIPTKIMFLEQLQSELNGFANQHPEPNSKTEDCKNFQQEIDTKLPEYQKMI